MMCLLTYLVSEPLLTNFRAPKHNTVSNEIPKSAAVGVGYVIVLPL